MTARPTFDPVAAALDPSARIVCPSGHAADLAARYGYADDDGPAYEPVAPPRFDARIRLATRRPDKAARNAAR